MEEEYQPDATAEGDEADALGIDQSLYTILMNKVSGGKRLTLYTDKPNLEAYLWVQPTSPYFELSYLEIEEAIQHVGLSIPAPMMQKINSYLESLRRAQEEEEDFDPESFKPIEINKGRPAKHGEDGRFEWFITEPDPEKLRFEPDVNGRIDFREMNTVINVNIDEPLVKIHPPTEGKSGIDVFGNVIPAENGEAKRLGQGKGVRFDEENQTMYAETSGHVEQKSGMLSVSPVFEVPGNVDFSVGNINFLGAVLVRKDVMEGFTIRATEGILVEGMVQQANLFCDGDIEVRGGLTASHGKGFVESKGRVLAKYMVNARVDSQGDMLVDTQIVNCDISCVGRLHIPNGKLLGGKTIALGGVEAGEIGTEVGTRTTVIVSVEHFTTAETRAIDRDIKRSEERLLKCESLVGPYMKDRSMLNELPIQKMENIVEQLEQLDEIQEELFRLQEEKNKILETYADMISDEIIIHKRIHPGVDVRIDSSRQVFADYIEGPIRLKPNYSRGTIAIHPL